MKPDDLLGLAEYLVSFGKKKGADQVEVSILESSEFSLDVRLGEIENLLEAESRYLTLKVIKNKKTAYATSSLLKKEPLQDLINNAVTRAALANPDEFSGLPSLPPEPRDVSLLKLFDPEIAELDSRTKIALALETEAMALKNPKITNSHGSSFETREVKTILSNSKGLSGVYTETLCSLGVGLQAGETDNRVEGYWSSTTRHFKELEPPETIAKKAVSRTLRQINPIKIKTQRVPVVFEPEMTSWIMGFLFACVSGISIYNRASFLVDKLDKKIGNDRIQVVDDGLMPGKLGSAPFDSEGVPCQRTILIERGVLKNYLCNTYAARKLNLTSTGNSSGNGVGPTNFYLKPGSTTPEEMIKSMDKGMILIRTLGHGLNPINGDISRGAFGLWVEGGEIVYPVSEITISGNLGTLLKETEMIGNDLEYRSPVSGPSIKIQELLVAGK